MKELTAYTLLDEMIGLRIKSKHTERGKTLVVAPDLEPVAIKLLTVEDGLVPGGGIPAKPAYRVDPLLVAGHWRIETEPTPDKPYGV